MAEAKVNRDTQFYRMKGGVTESMIHKNFEFHPLCRSGGGGGGGGEGGKALHLHLLFCEIVYRL